MTADERQVADAAHGDRVIVDGTTGALFVNAVKAKLEDVELWKRLT